MVFTGFLLLVFLAVAFPEMAPQGLLGILWAGAGVSMMLLPPVVRVPRLWTLLAAGFVVFSLIGFLPREWFHVPAWRTDLENLGLDTGKRVFVQAPLAVEGMAGFAVTALAAVYLLGHRINSIYQQRLALAFALGIAGWTTVALLMHKPGGLFGFFPNRNHTASLLAMGTFVGLGTLTHAIRRKDVWKILASVISVVVCLYSLHAVSESRAGVVLVLVGFAVWICLNGFGGLRGNVGKALLLILIAAGGTFLIVDSKSKQRLAATVEQISPAEAHSGPSHENPFSKGEAVQQDRPMDGRLAIFIATWDMIRHEPWTGVGPGQFAQVFPQYREGIHAPNDSKCLHPESDWLMLAAENGLLATLCVVVGVTAVFVTAVRQTRRGRSRFLRMGCIIAAILLCLHGFFDVPGHRIGLAWAALLLLAMSLRPQANGGSESVPSPSRFSKVAWRALGGVLAFAGIFLIQAQWVQRSVLPSAKVTQHLAAAQSFYQVDQAAYDKAKAEGRDYDPPPSEDPLEGALLEIKQALEVTPLDPYLHYLRGAFGLHYDTKRPMVEQAFAIQRRMDPSRVNLALEQANSWSAQDPNQVILLWKEAMRRASIEEAGMPNTAYGRATTYSRVARSVGNDEALGTAALALAEGDSSLLTLWALSGSKVLLDREMPRLIPMLSAVDARKRLFEIWEKRGSKNLAADFAENHPEFHLTPR
jgi:O-antigen ligase